MIDARGLCDATVLDPDGSIIRLGDLCCTVLPDPKLISYGLTGPVVACSIPSGPKPGEPDSGRSAAEPGNKVAYSYLSKAAGTIPGLTKCSPPSPRRR
jgi:hypothetical protein